MAQSKPQYSMNANIVALNWNMELSKLTLGMNEPHVKVIQGAHEIQSTLRLVGKPQFDNQSLAHVVRALRTNTHDSDVLSTKLTMPNMSLTLENIQNTLWFRDFLRSLVLCSQAGLKY
jgi:hypothetical protein